MRPESDEQMDPDEMAAQTRRMAKAEDEQVEGTARLASRPGAGGSGMSQSETSDEQPLDSKMAQQAHDPRQASEGGHARSGVAPRRRTTS